MSHMQTRSLLFAALSTAACGRSSEQGTQSVSDSLGVRIVTNLGPTWPAGSEWRVSPEAYVAIAAGSESSSQLLVVEGAIRLSDGTVVVGDRGAAAVKYFDGSGRLVRTSGRQGQGPGEFQYLAWLQPCGGEVPGADSEQGSDESEIEKGEQAVAVQASDGFPGAGGGKGKGRQGRQ